MAAKKLAPCGPNCRFVSNLNSNGLQYVALTQRELSQRVAGKRKNQQDCFGSPAFLYLGQEKNEKFTILTGMIYLNVVS